MNPTLRASAAHVFVESIDAPELAEGDRHHLQRVLRVRDRDVVTVSDGRGAWVAASIVNGELHIVDEVQRQPQPPTSTVVSAIPKGDRVDWIVQKLTEIGVMQIVLADFARSVVRWDADRLVKQRQRLQRVMIEAAMQSRRAWLPDLVIGEPFQASAQRPGATLAEPDGDPDVRSNCIIVGPEGGFSDDELTAPIGRICLGDTVLRVETAAVVGGLQAIAAARSDS